MARRLLGAGWSSRLLQGVLLELLGDPATAATLARARTTYADRRSRLTDALHERGVGTAGQDGINLWVEVADEQAAAYRLAAGGVGVAVGSPFVPGRPVRDHIRITSGLLPRSPRRRCPRRARGGGGGAAGSAAPEAGSCYLGCMRMAPSSRMTSPFR